MDQAQNIDRLPQRLGRPIDPDNLDDVWAILEMLNANDVGITIENAWSGGWVATLTLGPRSVSKYSVRINDAIIQAVVDWWSL